jgi:hypothetical protein
MNSVCEDLGFYFDIRSRNFIVYIETELLIQESYCESSLGRERAYLVPGIDLAVIRGKRQGIYALPRIELALRN